MATTVSEVVQVENWNIAQLLRIGVTPDVAVRATDHGVDYHEVEAFLKSHPTCSPDTAVQLVR